ncbi:hypothetical protein ILYODFUR_003372 [Ilyodon furcidens]|uniref:EGF-like domain-containing protein n=1 Tax=Ilyodon furcidens TaxID=33524 RepID=A0ABV0TT99_9TELE
MFHLFSVCYRGRQVQNNSMFVYVCFFFLLVGCEDGSFGLNCVKPCDCVDGTPCDPSTGRCLCLSGQWGQKCEKRCDGDRFGPDCSLLCQCFQGSRCDPINGRCLCPLTWFGPTCSEARLHQTSGVLNMSVSHRKRRTGSTTT